MPRKRPTPPTRRDPQATPGLAAYTPEGAAIQLCVCRATIYKLIREGKLRPSKIGKSTRISLEELQRYLREALVPLAS